MMMGALQLEACCSNHNLDVVRKAVPFMPGPPPAHSHLMHSRKRAQRGRSACGSEKACERRSGYVPEGKRQRTDGCHGAASRVLFAPLTVKIAAFNAESV